MYYFQILRVRFLYFSCVYQFYTSSYTYVFCRKKNSRISFYCSYYVSWEHPAFLRFHLTVHPIKRERVLTRTLLAPLKDVSFICAQFFESILDLSAVSFRRYSVVIEDTHCRHNSTIVNSFVFIANFTHC